MLKNMDVANPSKKVCIIVPVYNAEKYLGYCLNSILSQSYTNWTAILVDDGSTDSSLEICKNYAATDSRFRVFSKPNGGVSSARNYGLQYADGDYLEFLDSDDCLRQDALEKQVTLALEYHTPLVVTNMTMVDFNEPQTSSRVTLNSSWLGRSPCYLTGEEFRQKRMQLIWFTALLEGPCAKLYDLLLWQKLGLIFPKDLSLGEDFVTNMRYYEACSSAVFLNESCYYYNCYVGSGSLTEKYRSDLFEIKMYLNREMEKHLGGRQHLSAEAKDAFYCYVAGSGLVCLEKTVLISGLDEQAMSEQVEKMLDDNLFYESIYNAGYIAERFVPYLDSFKEKDYQKIIQGIRGEQPMQNMPESTDDNKKPEFSFLIQDNTPITQENVNNDNMPVFHNPGILNKTIRKVLRKIINRMKDGPRKERLAYWESDITKYGIKIAFDKHVVNHKKLNQKDLVMLNGRIEVLLKESRQIHEENRQLGQLLLEKEAQFTRLLNSMVAQQNNLLEAQADRIFGEVNARVYSIYNLLEAQTTTRSMQFDEYSRIINARFDALSNQMNDRNFAMDAQFNAINTRMHDQDCTITAQFDAANNRSQEMYTAVTRQLDVLAQLLSNEFEMQSVDAARSRTETAERIRETARNLQSEINGYTWVTEQRMFKYAYQRDINELRQRKKAIILASAEHSNIGDAAITLAEQLFLQEYFPDYHQVEISTYEFSQREAFLHVILNPEDVIFINGGGNMGDVYAAEEALHRKIVETFPNNKIIIFPQTIYFSATETGTQELEKSAQVYNRHPDLTLYLRGEESLRFAQKHFEKVKSALMPDMVHTLQTDYRFDREGALLCLREDSEGVLTTEQKQNIERDVLAQVENIAYSTNMYSEDIPRDIRGKVVRDELMRFARCRVVITDRLHGMIFAAVTGTPCVVMSSFNQKIREYYNTFFSDCNGIFFIGDNTELLHDTLKKALQIKESHYPILEQNPHKLIYKDTFHQ